jgi:hypothetical protein
MGHEDNNVHQITLLVWRLKNATGAKISMAMLES